MSEFDISRDNPAGGVTGFPEDSWVEVRYPLTGEQSTATAMPGRGCPAGWSASAALMSGRSASRLPNWRWSTRARRCIPVCFRDSSELRTPAGEPEAGS